MGIKEMGDGMLRPINFSPDAANCMDAHPLRAVGVIPAGMTARFLKIEVVIQAVTSATVTPSAKTIAECIQKLTQSLNELVAEIPGASLVNVAKDTGIMLTDPREQIVAAEWYADTSMAAENVEYTGTYIIGCGAGPGTMTVELMTYALRDTLSTYSPTSVPVSLKVLALCAPTDDTTPYLLGAERVTSMAKHATAPAKVFFIHNASTMANFTIKPLGGDSMSAPEIAAREAYYAQKQPSGDTSKIMTVWSNKFEPIALDISNTSAMTLDIVKVVGPVN